MVIGKDSADPDQKTQNMASDQSTLFVLNTGISIKHNIKN